MKYICMEDIEHLAAQGKKELILDENTILMDLARDMARQLGITILVGSSPATPAKVASPAPSSPPAQLVSPAALTPSSRDTAPVLGAKPKGCQHGPVAVTLRQQHSQSYPGSDEVVDQLVELVRQSTGKRTGN